LISAERNLEKAARDMVLILRQDIQDYIKEDERFFSSLEPIEIKKDAPLIVKTMGRAGKAACVGPMASVAGAISEFVGRALLDKTDEIIVENGGDIFIKSAKARLIGLYAGKDSPFTGNVGVEIKQYKNGIGVCTSSGTVSHSLSFGKADAVMIISEDAALSDAVATASGNMVKDKEDVDKAISFAKSIDGVKGV